ncbi:hypothetical protein [Streptomyces sp. NRRL S-87]|uniref:hypothetical protein n=1 Tax=Streptomyces sp. NRRL S-87 TaxID=1463920 RepID=UPI0004BF2483|nr:hypothetical protein [Streptomyces sp. NRRL S-87]
MRAAVVSAALAAMLVATGTGTAQGQAPTAARVAVPPADHNCLSPDGTNLNTFLGISERIIGPPACREAFVGEQWVRSFPSWGTAASGDRARYPRGYTPARFNPMDDFVSKFLGIRVVNDIGTAQEQSRTFGPETIRRFAVFEGIPFAYFGSLPLSPLSAGAHTSTVFMRLSAEHCDGLTRRSDLSCLPAGEFPYTGDTPVRFFPRSS